MRPVHVNVIAAVLGVVIGLVITSRTRGPEPALSETPWEYRLTQKQAELDRTRVLAPEARDGTFTFAAGTSPVDQQAFLDAVSTDIRPDAQRLVGLVDGLVNVSFGREPTGALGHAGPTRSGRFDVLLDVGLISSRLGRRGLRQVAMHELGHVVDFALIPDDLMGRLTAQIPVGYECPPGTQISACAPREERFAETFAKWSTGDLGAGLYAGYGVMPPTVTLDVWGAPLAEIAAG